MAKFTYKEIKQIIAATPAELKKRKISDFEYMDVGYFHPSQANWSYLVKTIIYNGRPELVAVVFGQIQ